MMSGPFIQGQQGYAVLPDEEAWSEASTIAAFAEFAFTGDYQITMALDTSPHAPVLNEGNMRLDFSAFFIAHAKVYIFADCYGVAGLLNLAMRKLHKALCGFRLSTLRIDDVVSLVDYCYNLRQTVPREAEDDGGVVLGHDYGFTGYRYRGDLFSGFPDEEEGFCSGHGLVHGVSTEEVLKISSLTLRRAL
ncbi:hypothetical protein E4U13_008241 [Claviceps humidiphila]|uniref:Uncharacterized protein n=1 Tax=Claviceps humidiphila TaxID=1294629 RepID=A0A9P7TW94_9HYPO|nr:hypothetical protein E4U13_008241 [Claviceps humidiphila]